MICSVRTFFHIVPVEKYILKPAFCIHKRLIIKVRGTGDIADSAGKNAFCLYLFTKFNCSDKTVATGTIHFFRTRVRAALICGQGSPSGRNKRHRETWLFIAELLHNISGSAADTG